MISDIQIWKEAKSALFNKDPEKTIELLSPLARNTLHPNLCVDLAKAHLQMKHYDEAKTFTLKALSLEPDLYEAHRLMADLLYYQQAYKEALAHYKRLIFLMPQDKSALTRCAYCLCQLRQFSEALVYFEKCLEGFDLKINKMPASWHLNYGMALAVGCLNGLRGRCISPLSHAFSLSTAAVSAKAEHSPKYELPLRSPNSRGADSGERDACDRSAPLPRWKVWSPVVSSPPRRWRDRWSVCGCQHWPLYSATP